MYPLFSATYDWYVRFPEVVNWKFKEELIRKDRKWAASPTYTSPIKFLEMQKKGRAREDGTVVVGEWVEDLNKSGSKLGSNWAL